MATSTLSSELLYSDPYTGTGYNFTIDTYKSGIRHIYGNINMSGVTHGTPKNICTLSHVSRENGYATLYPGNTSSRAYGYLLINNGTKALIFCPSSECSNSTVELRLDNWF